MKKKKGWFTAYHSGGLKECLETESRISKETALILIHNAIYTFYVYDERINADRYLLTWISKDFGLPTWLHYYE